MIPARRAKHADERTFQRKAQGLVIRRVLDLGVDADGPVLLLRLALHEGDDLLDGRDLEPAVELLRPLRKRLDRPQRLYLRQREVRREPPLVLGAIDDRGTTTAGKLGMVGHV